MLGSSFDPHKSLIIPDDTASITGSIYDAFGYRPSGTFDWSPPLNLACQLEDQTIARMLLEKGADIEGLDRQGRTPLNVAVDSACMFTTRNFAPLAELLLQHHANVLPLSASQSIPLSDAAYHGQVNIVKLLLKYGGIRRDFPNYLERPLQSAAGNGHSTVVKLLLNAGANPRYRDSYGRTALYWARLRGDAEIVRMVVSAMNHKHGVVSTIKNNQNK